MKRTLIALAAAGLLAGSAWSQPYGMGPGMMGGYGPGGYGPGGYGMGPGMMGGYGGGYGMGPGMMGGYGGGYEGLDLSAEQRKKIAQIRDETAQAQWKLMGTMHQQGNHMFDTFGPGALDEQAARKSFQTMVDAQKAMFESSLAAHKRIDAVLTKEQREQLSRRWGTR